MEIVDKLRNYAERHARDDAERLLVTEAADEIEHLRRAYHEAKELASTAQRQGDR